MNECVTDWRLEKAFKMHLSKLAGVHVLNTVASSRAPLLNGTTHKGYDILSRNMGISQPGIEQAGGSAERKW